MLRLRILASLFAISLVLIEAAQDDQVGSRIVPGAHAALVGP